jgi:hypothetical protein
MILDANITAGHDGEADLVLRVRYENGQEAHITLDTQTGADLMRRCGANSICALAGHPLSRLFDGD